MHDLLVKANKKVLRNQKVSRKVERSQRFVGFFTELRQMFHKLRIPVVTIVAIALLAITFEEGMVIAAGPSLLPSASMPTRSVGDIGPRYRHEQFTAQDYLSDPLETDTAATTVQFPERARYHVHVGIEQYASEIEPVSLRLNSTGQFEISLDSLPSLSSEYSGRLVGRTERDELVFYTLDRSLQEYTEKLISEVNAPHAAVVVMNPRTNEILALAGKSKTLRDPLLHAGFPAASLFKLVTASAALEKDVVEADTPVRFRGGTYTLKPWNYRPDKRRDNRSMTLAEAMGRSCNAVFARIALKHLSPASLVAYANSFGFNMSIPFDVPLPMSTAQIPESDYQFTRTSAGFGNVHISPIHAVSLMSGIATGGVLHQPRLISQVTAADGQLIYEAKATPLRRIVQPSTADTLMDLMEYTTTIGTSRREFMKNKQPLLSGIPVSGKTGTLRGQNPYGINNWFIGAAPKDDPEIAVATIVVYPNWVSTRASRLARKLIQKYFDDKDPGLRS